MGLHNEYVEFDALSADPPTPPDGCTWYRADLDRLRVQANGTTKSLPFLDEVAPSFSYGALDLLTPNNADWAINAAAGLAADSNNAGFFARLFDDTTEEGVGWEDIIPSGSTNLHLQRIVRAETGPGAARTVGGKLRNRGSPDGAVVAAWTTGLALADISIPMTTEYWIYHTQVITLASLSATAGELTTFELTRVAPGAGMNLEGDLALCFVGMSFS